MSEKDEPRPEILGVPAKPPGLSISPSMVCARVAGVLARAFHRGKERAFVEPKSGDE